MSDLTGIVFNVQRFTVHDGPGIRTEFFLKGCNLRCNWCGNPESFIKQPQIGVFTNQCIGVDVCGDCISICPQDGEKVFNVQDNKVISINRELCDNCLKCYDECPSDALKLWGEEMTVEDAMKIIRKDKAYYKENNGGVTISGGEALLQHKFVKEVFKQCKEEGYHTCVETALHVKKEVIDEIMPYTDMVITDIKHLNEEVHKSSIGTGNSAVLENMKYISTLGKQIVLRIPIIPGFNDNEKDILNIGDFIINEMNNKILQLQLLRFRPLGGEKYEALSIPYKMEVTKERSDFEEEIKNYVKLLKEKGIKAEAGATMKIEI